MNLRTDFQQTTEILNRFVQVINRNTLPVKSTHIQRAALTTAGDLAGAFENLVVEFTESDILYKLNHTIDLTGSLIFWTKNLESISALTEQESREYQNHFTRTKNLLFKLKNESGKTTIPAFNGEWLLID